MCFPRDEWVRSEHGTNARDVGRPFCNLIGFEIYDHARNVSIVTRPLPHVMSGWGLGTRLQIRNNSYFWPSTVLAGGNLI